MHSFHVVAICVKDAIVTGTCGPKLGVILFKILIASKPVFTGMWKTVNMLLKRILSSLLDGLIVLFLFLFLFSFLDKLLYFSQWLFFDFPS